jgi:hypothetical protein
MPASPGITFEVDDRSYRKAMARLSKYEGRAFTERMIRVFTAGAQLLVAPMRAEIRSSVKGHGTNPGMLAQKVAVRRRRYPPAGYFVQVSTKSRAPHAHLVDLGTTGHSLQGGTSKYRARTGKSEWSVLPDGHVIPNRLLWHPGGAARRFTQATLRYEGRSLDFIRRNVANDDVSVTSLATSIRSLV